jgi:hypothetical protein
MLDRLESKALIYWHKVKTVCVASSISAKNELGDVKVRTEIIIDEYDNEEIKLSTKTNEFLEYRVATDEEIELILEIEDEVMENLNCKTKQELVVKDKWNIFIKQSNEILQERANILFRYDSYKIIRNKNKISKEAEKVEHYLSQEDILKGLNMLSLNKDVQNQIMANWKKRNIKATFQNELGIKSKNNKLRCDENYIENGGILIDNFINTNHAYIVSELKHTKLKL